MNSIDNRKTIWDSYKQNWLFAFKSPSNEKKYIDFVFNNSFFPLALFKILMIFILIFDLLYNFFLDRLAIVCALVAVNAMTAKWPRINKFLAFGLVLQSEASNAISQNVLIMLEFVYHASTSVSIEKHLLVLLIKEMCFKSVSRNLVEYTTMSIVLILLKKDFKGLWAMKEYYSDLVTDLQKASNRFNCGYFIINDSGDILEMNPIAVNISIALCEDSTPLHITNIFSKEHTQRIFSMINIAKKGLIAEEEFLFIFKPPKQYDEFSSILTRIMPITIHGMKSFLLIIKDISRFVTLRSVAVTTMRNVQSYTNTLANKISNCYTKQNAITENEVYMSLDHFYRQLDIEGLLSFMLGASEVSMCDFDIRIEVVNMIQICWKNWTDNNFKVNLVVDKDLPCVRNDRLKHNQLLKMLLEYTLLHTDKNSDLLLTLSQTVILT